MIAALQLVACASLQDKFDQFQAHMKLEKNREKLADGFFESVVIESKQILKNSETRQPADVALYTLGEVYAHHDYKERDLALSKYYFNKLVDNFPDSQLASEAKVYINLFETISAKEEEANLLKKNSEHNEKVVQRKINLNNTIQLAGKIVENNDFAEAISRNMQIIDKSGRQNPADQALYNLGLLYADDNNPEQDYKKSQQYFQQLAEFFPDSRLAQEAHVWLGLFEKFEKIYKKYVKKLDEILRSLVEKFFQISNVCSVKI